MLLSGTTQAWEVYERVYADASALKPEASLPKLNQAGAIPHGVANTPGLILRSQSAKHAAAKAVSTIKTFLVKY
jgi:hypothetical protein